MDANQTRFHLLLGQRDWARTAVPSDSGIFQIPNSKFEWDNGNQELRLRSELFRFKAAPRDDPPRQDDRRGAAADSYDNWFWIGTNRDEIRVRSSGELAPTHFWSASDAAAPALSSAATFQPVDPVSAIPPRPYRGLAITEDHYLVVGTIAPAGLLVFDLFGGGTPRMICWPTEIAFAPFDIVPRRGGGVWILDRENKRFWALDRALRAITNEQSEQTLRKAEEEIFQPTEGEPRISTARTFPQGVALEPASPIQAQDPVAIEALSDGSVLILDAPARETSRVLRYRFATWLGEVELDFPAYDFAFAAGRLYIASAEGNQSYAFILGDLTAQSLSLSMVEEYFPMRRFGGKALVAANDRAYYDFGERWLPLVAQSQPRFAIEGIYQTSTWRDGAERLGFDGRDPQCVWHRLILDACLPPTSAVQVWSRAADDEDELSRTAWQAEPSPVRRSTGSELPFVPAPVSQNRGTFELLLQNAKGRYLQLQLRLTGNGQVTPRLHALRVYYPRFSYLEHYLPAVYREDASSASFLDRFLANLEGTNTAIEDRIAAVQMLFDVRSVPADALSWLASWYGVVFDPNWDEMRQRLFLAYAMEFFRWRGTARGLKMALRLAFEEQPDDHIFDPPGKECRCADRYRIVEKFLTREFPPVELGDPTAVVTGPSLAPGTGRWLPEHGAAALHARYKTATGQETFTFTPLPDANQEAARVAFAESELGFVPSDPTEEIAAWSAYQTRAGVSASPLPENEPTDTTIDDLWRAYQTSSAPQPYGVQRKMWQQFLVRRYLSVTKLNEAHETDWKSFDIVGYPFELPENLARLQDWFEFEAHVLPTLAAAHRFTVLLPVTRTTATSDADRRRDLALAGRIIELEKPAHTIFDVKFFWAYFRVGEARLGADTVLGLGSRDPALLPRPVVLGESYLSESLIDAGPPPSGPGRIITGRDRLNRKPTT
jgi:phage tail-like protein